MRIFKYEDRWIYANYFSVDEVLFKSQLRSTASRVRSVHNEVEKVNGANYFLKRESRARFEKFQFQKHGYDGGKIYKHFYTIANK